MLYLTALNQRELYGQAYRMKQDVTTSDVSSRIRHVVAREIDAVRNQLTRNHVATHIGSAHFLDPHTLAVVGEHGQQ